MIKRAKPDYETIEYFTKKYLDRMWTGKQFTRAEVRHYCSMSGVETSGAAIARIVEKLSHAGYCKAAERWTAGHTKVYERTEKEIK